MGTAADSNGRILNIGVLIGALRSRHREELLHGIVEASKKCNVNIFAFVSVQRKLESRMNDGAVGETIYQLHTTYNYARFADLDALIIADGALLNLGQDYAPDIREFLSAFDNIPHFILGGEEENGNYIITDNRQGIRSIMDHLIVDHGYSRLVFLSGPLSIKDVADRYAAFLDCMLSYGLPVDERMVAFGDLSDDVEPVVEKLLDENPDAQAIVCANDDMCLAVYQVCERRKLRIGVDIAVTG
jgi:DNA-binding LacI/PurR family transcriptional regulator